VEDGWILGEDRSNAVGTEIGDLRRVGDNEGDLDFEDPLYVIGIGIAACGGCVGLAVDDGSEAEKAAWGTIPIGSGSGMVRWLMRDPSHRRTRHTC
jgi:hypothetical protein